MLRDPFNELLSLIEKDRKPDTIAPGGRGDDPVTVSPDIVRRVRELYIWGNDGHGMNETQVADRLALPVALVERITAGEISTPESPDIRRENISAGMRRYWSRKVLHGRIDAT